MDDLISRQAAIDALKHNQDVYSHNFHDDPIDKYTTAIIAADIDSLVNLPPAQPELIEQSAYVRGFEQGRTQGMIDAKVEELCSSAQPDNTCNGCRYERFGNRVCDQCSRFYMDRYEVKQNE